MAYIPNMIALFVVLLLSMRVQGQNTTIATPTAAITLPVTSTAPGNSTLAGNATTTAPTMAPNTTAAPPGTALTTKHVPTSAPPPAPPIPGPGECKDDNPFCSRWTKDGECQNNQVYMLRNCKLSCDACEGKVVKAVFRLTNEVYNDNLAGSNSSQFIALKNKVETLFSAELNKTLEKNFLKFNVLSFKKGSVLINSEVIIRAESQNYADASVLNAIKKMGISGLDVSSSSVGVIACSTGFVDVNDQCLMFSIRTLSWKAAKEECERLKSRLVVPNAFEMLTSYILRKNIIWQYWVGASDQATPGTYEWLDGSSTELNSDRWYSGSPMMSGIHRGQSCVKIHTNSNTNNGLIAAYDTNCDGMNTYRYICEEN